MVVLGLFFFNLTYLELHTGSSQCVELMLRSTTSNLSRDSVAKNARRPSKFQFMILCQLCICANTWENSLAVLVLSCLSWPLRYMDKEVHIRLYLKSPTWIDNKADQSQLLGFVWLESIVAFLGYDEGHYLHSFSAEISPWNDWKYLFLEQKPFSCNHFDSFIWQLLSSYYWPNTHQDLQYHSSSRIMDTPT